MSDEFLVGLLLGVELGIAIGVIALAWILDPHRRHFRRRPHV